MTVAGDGIWVLGYGSLIYKPPPHFRYRLPVLINGYVRRFWQSSVDHRGTHARPGRVATLIHHRDVVENPEFRGDVVKYHSDQIEDFKTFGVVYYIDAEHVDEVVEYLDVREQNGYSNYVVEVQVCVPDTGVDKHLGDLLSELPIDSVSGRKLLRTSVYIGTIDNEAFVGFEELADTAAVIATSVGPSGKNYDYLKLLLTSLIEIRTQLKLQDGLKDQYLHDLMAEVEGIKGQQ